MSRPPCPAPFAAQQARFWGNKNLPEPRGEGRGSLCCHGTWEHAVDPHSQYHNRVALHGSNANRHMKGAYPGWVADLIQALHRCRHLWRAVVLPHGIGFGAAGVTGQVGGADGQVWRTNNVQQPSGGHLCNMCKCSDGKSSRTISCDVTTAAANVRLCGKSPQRRMLQ